MMKIIKLVFKKFGFNISLERIVTPTNKYFNNGSSPYAQNTPKANDLFYQDNSAIKDYYQGDRLIFYSEIVNLLKDNNINLISKKILDAGCGSGHLLYYIHQKFPKAKLYGFDFSPLGVKLAQNMIKTGDIFVHDIYAPHKSKYHLIICTEVFEHLQYPSKALNNLLSMLLKNGKLFISVPNGRIDSLEEHINFWSPESWKEFILANINDHKYTVQFGSTTHHHNYVFLKKIR